ncbi:hypothetical protein DAPPUDRAFT_302757 [Daphnia pulex]|uniref:High-affinity choline transporter 1 n=1 Tax=Daphnia pulex TaxID=6669 RepID=E9HPP1_DAPPU|nr:hypothetical protein DAPPUDRAFT_302757 [Daphnia pulex]|eukprot:EFX66306.1 hypothetical protein DAPPUDRAFT_302757 [Daphnia pulex]
MTINVPGLVSIVTFYILILAVGIWAGWKNRGKGSQGGTEQVMLAGRDIGTFVGILTMTATWVGGGYVIGSAEGAFTSGVVWCQAPFGFGISLIVAGLFFANPMRSAGYHTMLDPFQEKYGAKIGGLLFLPALCGEILWSSAILSALGSTLSVIVGLDTTISVVVSAAVAMLYTLFGGLHSVAYTDVVQVFCIAIGLTICVPFAWTHKAVDTKALTIPGAWEGVIEIYNVGVYIENYLLIVIGGIPWQVVYFQRVLACRTPKQAQTISYMAGLGAILLAAPPICLGVIARVTDWSAATHGTINVTAEEHGKMILPLMLQFLTPPWVSFIGLGAISAAVMSSADSSILSTSSMFARNIYQAIFFTDASERHVLRVMWVAIVIVAALASLMALTVNSIYGLFLLSADLVYVLLFPQLLLILYWNEYCNSYGCIASFSTGFLFRILGGEPLIGLPAILAYPFYDRNLGQLFPFRTMSMIISLMSHVIVSLTTRWIFLNSWLPASWDLLKCFSDPVTCTAVNIRQVGSIATISQFGDPRRKSHDGTINVQHQDLNMGRMYIPRPKLRRNSAHGIYRRSDNLSSSSQR